jgi:hypothetical protein
MKLIRFLVTLIIYVSSPVTGSIFNLAYAETYKFRANPIKAKISYQNLNRISVKNDKIDSILGIDNAFHFEKNDKTGEAFIRPTEDNGYSPISLSVTTMSGKTQDLLLEPVEGEANTIELVSDDAGQDLSPLLDIGVSEESIGNDYEETVSSVMKKFINFSSKLKSIEVTGVLDRFHKRLRATFESAYNIDGFMCLKFKVTTEKEGAFRLDERMFSQKGDVALSLSTLSINNKSAATLYVLRK